MQVLGVGGVVYFISKLCNFYISSFVVVLKLQPYVMASMSLSMFWLQKTGKNKDAKLSRLAVTYQPSTTAAVTRKHSETTLM